MNDIFDKQRNEINKDKLNHYDLKERCIIKRRGEKRKEKREKINKSEID